MKLHIEQCAFGSLTIDGTTYPHDVVIRLDGTIVKRKKKLSKKKYGTSHKISEKEIAFIFNGGARVLVIGSGHYGRVRLSNKAQAFLRQLGCEVQMAPTPEAIHLWNEREPGTIGLFHLTC